MANGFTRANVDRDHAQYRSDANGPGHEATNVLLPTIPKLWTATSAAHGHWLAFDFGRTIKVSAYVVVACAEGTQMPLSTSSQCMWSALVSSDRGAAPILKRFGPSI